MQIKNSTSHYGIISIFIHWIMALLMIGLIILGLYMVNLPINAQKLKLYGWHKELGILVIFLAIFRLFWRIIDTAPTLPAHMPWFQKFAAHAVHYAFYGFMFALPISGWMISSAAGLPVSFFGLFVLPDLVSTNEPLRLLLQEVHEWLGYGLILAIVGHMGAALYHHFVYKDDILRRILP